MGTEKPRILMGRLRAILGLAAALLLAGPASAQSVGTPGTGPLTPGGPRQGLGPPSLSDSVPDLRLHSDGGGIPGAGAPINGGGYRFAQPPARTGLRPIGGDIDRHGCRPAAGYQWCARTQKCERPWELARVKRFANSAQAFRRYCGAGRR